MKAVFVLVSRCCCYIASICWLPVTMSFPLQGPYVLVLVAMGAAGFGPEDERRSRLPAMWLIKCYARLTRPYKKNVGPPN